MVVVDGTTDTDCKGDADAVTEADAEVEAELLPDLVIDTDGEGVVELGRDALGDRVMELDGVTPKGRVKVGDPDPDGLAVVVTVPLGVELGDAVPDDDRV